MKVLFLKVIPAQGSGWQWVGMRGCLFFLVVRYAVCYDWDWERCDGLTSLRSWTAWGRAAAETISTRSEGRKRMVGGSWWGSSWGIEDESAVQSIYYLPSAGPLLIPYDARRHIVMDGWRALGSWKGQVHPCRHFLYLEDYRSQGVNNSCKRVICRTLAVFVVDGAWTGLNVMDGLDRKICWFTLVMKRNC